MSFSKKVFNPSGRVVEDAPAEEKKEFVRDEGDNYLFKEIQVDDIKPLITKDCVFFEDYDTPVYRAASMLEEKRITAVHKEDPSIRFDCKNKTEFKGSKRSDVAADKSVLGLFNVDRELSGLPPLKPSEFEITEYQKLKMDDEEKLFESGKITLLKSMKNTKEQYNIPKIIPVLGQGACFREDAPTVQKYKGERDKTARPLMLKRLREWMLKERGAIDTSTMRHNGKPIEADDFIEIKASEGYRHYRKTGKFNIGVISSDKDSLNSPKLVINRDTLPKKSKVDKAKLKFPKPMLIEATDRDAGDVVLISKESGQDFKGYGFKFLMYQAILGEDSADDYSAIRNLKQNLNFGDLAAYKVLKPCDTAFWTLQESINTMATLFPYGVQYTDWKGNYHDVDTMTYMNIYFGIAYMLRSLDDKMDFYKLCELMKVDTSKVVNNNRYTAPERVFVGNEATIKSNLEVIQDILKNDYKGIKTLKKVDKDAQLDKIKEKLESLLLTEEDHYEMQQSLKEQFKEGNDV